MQLSPDAVRGAVFGGLQLLDLDTTLIPGNLRKQINVLAVILEGVASGNMAIVNPPKPEVQSHDAGRDESGQVLPEAQGKQGRKLSREDLSVIDRGKSGDGKAPEAPEAPTPPEDTPA